MSLNMMTLNDHIKSFIAIWGEDYTYDLIDRGYTPILVKTGNSVKLSWKFEENSADEEDAARAYDNAALEFFGEFAVLNFPGLTNE